MGTLALVTSSLKTQMATPPVQANLAQEMTLAQDTTVCCNIGPKCLSMSLIQNTNGFQTRFQTLMATPPAQANLAQEMTLAQAMTLAQDTTVCCNIGPKCPSMSLIQNTNGFQTRFQTQMATPPAQEMTLAQGLRTLALVTSSLKTQMATPPVQANLAQDTTVWRNIGRKCLSMRLIQNTNGFQTQMATPPAQANLAQGLRTLAQGLRTLDLATAQDQPSLCKWATALALA